MVSFFKQLKLVIWKNFLLNKTKPVALVVEIMFPMIMMAPLLILRDN